MRPIRRLSLHFVALLTITVLLGAMRPPPATSQTVLVGFEAVIAGVYDPAGYIPWYMEDDLDVGDTLRGYYVYELGVPDGNPSPNAGFYAYYEPPFQLVLYAGTSWSFRTDSASVDGRVTVADSLTSQSETYDRFRVWSGVNVGDLSTLGTMFMDLYDPTLSAQSGDSLPDGPPDLGAWPDKLLYINGTFNYWTITAELIWVGETLPTAVGAPPPLPNSVGPTRPNPFNPSTTIPIRMAQAGEAKVFVTTIRGKIVRLLHNGRLTPGPHEFTWDGRDDRGRSLASGLYLMTLETNGRRSVAKATLLK